MVVWIVAATAFAGDCASAVKAEQVGGNVEDAMLAYATLDEDGFRASAAKAKEELPCVEDQVSPTRAAAYHRMEGLLAFIDGDPTTAQKSFAAALSIEPDYKLSAKIAPEGGKLARMYDGAAVIPREAPVAFTAPRGTKSFVDGAASGTRVPDFPAIVQIMEGTTARTTAYVAGGQPLPDFGGGSAVADVVDVLDAPLDEPVGKLPKEDVIPDKPAKEPREKGGKSGMWVGAGISAGVAAGLFATSAASRMAFDANPSAGTYYVTNGAYFGSIGAAAVAVGLSGIAIGGTF